MGEYSNYETNEPVKKDFALNNLQSLIYHKTQPNQKHLRKYKQGLNTYKNFKTTW